MELKISVSHRKFDLNTLLHAESDFGRGGATVLLERHSKELYA